MAPNLLGHPDVCSLYLVFPSIFPLDFVQVNQDVLPQMKRLREISLFLGGCNRKRVAVLFHSLSRDDIMYPEIFFLKILDISSPD